MPEQTHLENDEITLSTSVTPDWRVISQDSITSKDIQQGCISLFDQVDSDKRLSQTERNHAIRFLNYTGLLIEHRIYSLNDILEGAHPEEEHRTTRLLSSLINLVSLPSDPLRTAVLSFFDVGLRKSSRRFSVAVGSTGLLAQLFNVLKPHELPFNETTIEFHRHLVSIVDDILHFSSPEHIDYHLDSSARTAEVSEPMCQSFCSYLQSLIATPACPTDPCPGLTVLLRMTKFSPSFVLDLSLSSAPTLRKFFGQIWQQLSEELVSVLGLLSSSDAARIVDPPDKNSVDALAWTKQFEYLLGEVSKGRQFTDLGVVAVMNFLFRRPHLVRLIFCSDDTIKLKLSGQINSSSKLDSKAFWTLFTPTRPHHTALVYKVFREFMGDVDKETFLKQFWSRWFTHFVNAVDPSKLPFTADFITVHAELVKLLNEHLTEIRKFEDEKTRPSTDSVWGFQGCGHEEPRQWTPELRREIDELHLEFFKQTKDYIVHLSHHPFALDEEYHDTILDFLSLLFGSDCDHRKTRSFREEVRREMDASALSSSPPPFILTSDLISPHSDPLILNIVDRIVALLTSDSSLDDDTILRICVFCKRSFGCDYLPEVFRKAGRSTEQYLHALESLLSLHVEFYDHAPIKNLLCPRHNTLQPTFDEWDDVDLDRLCLGST
ncbi:hypothetical protein BLNAU_21617 [Blattamonas nauphoetae]|uniref:Uncharacterized protein n=1 Tax=Blattamonas nauphoetae TaxID=2049346 RepID=A0ABQ9WWD0_9EUKA|nr:hypothetical protein BLNAU_21617 [Blattamonas nauphoetae]